VREFRFTEGAALFDSSYTGERRQLPAGLRYQRARIAEELSDWSTVVECLDALEEVLPLFGPEIENLRTRAQAKVGPFVEAAMKLKRSAKHGDQMLAVEALRQADKPEEALELIASLLREASKKKTEVSEQAALRRARVDVLLGQQKKSEAALDLRWLALEAPDAAASEGADDLYEALSEQLLTKLQRYARAEKFTEARDLALAERELKKLAQAPGTSPNGADVLRTRAWAYYNSRADYQKAADLFRQASELDPRYRTQDLFLSARALSRANQDEAAIKQYLAVAKRFPKSSYAEQARYLAARLHYFLGHFKQAEAGFVDYSARYTTKARRGRYEDATQYERSVARLAQGRGASAVADLQQLVSKEKSDRERAALRELLGVALFQAGKHDAAEKELQRVVQERPLSFVALMAEVRLKQMQRPPARRITPREPASAPKNLLVNLPPKVELLAEWGLHEDAEDELAAEASEFAKRFEPEGGRALCEAYGRLDTAKQRYRHASRTVKESVLHEEVAPSTRWAWDCIYPQPYAESVARYETPMDIPENLVHALMRQESAFQASAASPVGATGLMQLMPDTARRVAEELGRPLELGELRSPPTNIQLGTHYLGKLLVRFNGHVPCAVAAYNAGPGAVDRWLAGAPGLDLDLFVARIPYDETRNYVRNVVGNWARYRYLNGGLSAIPELALKLPEKSKQGVVDY
jgi:soluble lytic murein transglycosylase